MGIKETIDLISKEVEEALLSIKDEKDIEFLKIKYLGKKGQIGQLMAELGKLSSEERPHQGKWINDLKEHLQLRFEFETERLSKEKESKRFKEEVLDVTLPGRRSYLGRKHVVLAMLDEVISVLTEMGFSVQYGPEIESEYYNYDALNFPKDHPARDMQDTFYLAPDILLRTHTSNTQVRVMEGSSLPIRIIAPGKCYRNEDVNARSHVVFHQVEGLYIDKGVNFSDLLATLEELFIKLFHKDLKLRFRPSYFPFVEPGMEVDIQCLMCEGKGCSMCKQSGWLEVAGAGMVHPEVLKSGGIDPEIYTGYAWGFGIERLTILKHGINDIRLIFENHIGFLQQF